jgi:hypothetical protein
MNSATVPYFKVPGRDGAIIASQRLLIRVDRPGGHIGQCHGFRWGYWSGVLFGKSYLMYIVWLTQYRGWNFKKLFLCGSVSTTVFQARQPKASMYNIYM